jgi:hypothetical protein
MGEPGEVTRIFMFFASEDSALNSGADYVLDSAMLLGPVAPTDS